MNFRVLQKNPSTAPLRHLLHQFSMRGFNVARGFTAERGFTLIELMIVLLIIGILAAIAYPSYLQYGERVCRAEAKNTLYIAAQYLERFASQNGGTVAGAALPSGLTQSKANSGVVPGYDIALALEPADPLFYRLVATRNACPAPSTPSTGCTSQLTLDNTGYKGVANGGVPLSGAGTTTAQINACWVQ